MRGLWRALGFLLGLALLSPGMAAPPLTRQAFRSYGREQGLGNITVGHLLQDRQGFIWAGTDDGLYRYDGNRFKLFGTAQGLLSPLVNVLHLDRSGEIWVGTDRGLARFRGGRFEMMAQGIPLDSTIEDMANGSDGELWVATRMGIYSGNAEKGFRESAAWGKNQAYALAASLDGTKVWAAGRRSLYCRASGQEWTLVPQAGLTEGIERLFIDPAGSLWARSSKALFVMAPGESHFRAIEGMPPAESSRSRIFADDQGRLWFPHEKGLACLEAGRWIYAGLAEGLPMDFARALLVDQEGSLWVGSHGLFRALGRGLWRYAGPKEALPVPIWSFHRDRGKGLWVGTQKGLARRTPKGWQVIKGTEGQSLRSVKEGLDGSLFMAGDGGKVFRFDPKTNRLTSLPPLPGSPTRIQHLLLEPNGSLWIATRNAGLLLAKPSGTNWTYETVSLPGSGKKERIFCLLRDRHGTLWAAGDQGLACLVGGRWLRFTRQHGLRADAVTYLAEAPSGDLWVAYLSPIGLSRVRLDGEHLQVMQALGPEAGLTSLEIYLLGLDAQGRLWVGSNKGVDIVSHPESAKPKVWHQGIEDGLVDEDTDAMAFLGDPNGEVWIGTRGGLAHFVGSPEAGPTAPPRTVILSAKLGGTSLLGRGEARPSFSHRENTLEVNFAALSFANEASIQQQIWLEGLDHEWVAQDTREIRYPGLAPKQYQLHLRSRCGQGDWGPECLLAFTIRPPWWQTWWFRIPLILGLGGLGFAYLRWRIQALRRHNAELAELVVARTRDLEKRTAELELANQALESMSLTDPLTGLRNRRFLDLTISDDVAQTSRNHRDTTANRHDRMLLNIDLIFILVDLDHFKQVNDEYGHGAGDRVLQQTGNILRNATRESDSAIRWGGEEFLIVARNACRKDAPILVERIRSQMESHAFDLGEGRTLHRTCSLGFTYFPFHLLQADLFTWEQAIEISDRCLYAAKRGGRNAWVGLSPADQSKPEDLQHMLPAGIDALCKKGVLKVETSLANADGLDWSILDPSLAIKPVSRPTGQG